MLEAKIIISINIGDPDRVLLVKPYKVVTIEEDIVYGMESILTRRQSRK